MFMGHLLPEIKRWWWYPDEHRGTIIDKFTTSLRAQHFKGVTKCLVLLLSVIVAVGCVYSWSSIYLLSITHWETCPTRTNMGVWGLLLDFCLVDCWILIFFEMSFWWLWKIPWCSSVACDFHHKVLCVKIFSYIQQQINFCNHLPIIFSAVAHTYMWT